jgi:hypothetical protein
MDWDYHHLVHVGSQNKSKKKEKGGIFILSLWLSLSLSNKESEEDAIPFLGGVSVVFFLLSLL